MDYVEAMWRILQHDQPDDFVVATGESHSVREFCEVAFREAGMEIEWKGSGKDEVGILIQHPDNPSNKNPLTGKKVIQIDPRYFRPTEVDFLLGDASRARRTLNWEPSVTFKELVRIMVQSDTQALLNLQRCQDVIQQIINGNKNL